MTKNIINTIILTTLIFSLLRCGNCQQTEPKEENGAATIMLESEKTTVMEAIEDTVGMSNAIASANELTVGDIIASDLILLEDKLKRDCGRMSYGPLPYCERCSNLEFILYIKRKLGACKLVRPGDSYRNYYTYYEPIPRRVTGATYLTRRNKKMLRDVELQYMEKFDIPVPWWWICSVEERIKRLEIAIKTNKSYPYYPANDSVYYGMGKTMATYEMWFKRPLPECTKTSCSEYRRLEHANQALDEGLPYLSEEEDIMLKNKLKAMYKKRFGIPIPDNLLSVARIYASYRTPSGDEYIIVTRTASGDAVAKYVQKFVQDAVHNTLKLNMRDWLDLINALYTPPTDEMVKGKLPSANTRWRIDRHYKIFTLNTMKDSTGGYCVGNIEIQEIDTRSLPNKETFGEIIDDMGERIEKNGKESYGY